MGLAWPPGAGPPVGVHSPAERCGHTGPSPLCSHRAAPSQSGLGTSLLSYLDSNLKLGQRKDKREEEGGKGREEKPSSHTHQQTLVMEPGGTQGLGKAVTVIGRVKFQGSPSPLGGYFRKAAFLQQSGDWLLQTLESGRLRALPGPSAGRDRRTAPEARGRLTDTPKLLSEHS